MRKFFLYAALFLLSCTLPAQGQTWDDLFLTATAAYAEGQYGQAKELFTQLHAQNPDDDAVNYYLGLCELNTRDLDAAETHLLQAVQADSTNTWYIFAMATLYDARRDQIRAADYIEKLIKMFGRTEVLRRTGNFPAFFAALEELIHNEDLRPEMKSNYLTVLMDNIDASFYWVWGDTINRLVDLDRELHPEDYDIQLLKLRMCYIKQDWQAVLDQCDVMADLAHAEGNNDHLAEALSIAGDVWYQQMEDRKKAYETYEQALKADPDRTSVLNNYAYYLSLEGKQLRKALKMSRRTVELEPDNATYLDTYGWLLYLLHRPKEAKPYFKHAMLYGGKDSAVILEHYSKVLEALGEDDLALYYKNLSEQKSR